MNVGALVWTLWVVMCIAPILFMMFDGDDAN